MKEREVIVRERRFDDGILDERKDVGELIRCKDCKYYTGYECQRTKVSNIRVITNEDDYCSRAERKETS